MSIAEQVEVIRQGLFTDEYPADAMRPIFRSGTQMVVHWSRVRPAVVALAEMPWYSLDREWSFFLDEERYPVERPMVLRPDEAVTFTSLIQRLLSQTGEPMRALMAVHANEISLYNILVAIGAMDSNALERALRHVRRTVRTADTGDAVNGSSLLARLNPGSHVAVENDLSALDPQNKNARSEIASRRSAAKPRSEGSTPTGKYRLAFDVPLPW